MNPRSGVHLAAFFRRHGRALICFALPFALILYLALRGGGYDPVTRGGFGVAVWLIVAIGAALGALTMAGWTRAAWTLIAVLGGFTAWSALAVIWSDSADKTVSEVARVATYGGVLVLGLCLGTREDLKRIVAGVGTALAAIALLALASRLEPSWFPRNEAAEVLPETVKRLNYPVGYWNGLATMIAIGIPLMLWLASSAIKLGVRALSAAALPAMMLAGYMTLSRGGVAEIVVALIAFLCLHPNRFALLPTLVNVSAGGLVLVYMASRRADLADGLRTPLAASQAEQMALAVVSVAVVVALVEAAIVIAGRRGIGPRPSLSRTAFSRIAIGAAGAVLIAGVVVGAPDRISQGWSEFKAPVAPDTENTVERLSSASGNGRWQYWTVAVDTGKDEPFTGVGPGTWEFRWSRDGTIPAFVRDSHSLYLEAFAELGIVGFVLIVSLVGAALVIGVRRTRRAPEATRVALAGATAACAAFATAAALDWSWELPVIPVAVMLLFAVVATSERERLTRPELRRRIGPTTAALIGALAVAVPLPGTLLVRSSQHNFNDGNLQRAIEQAEDAEDWAPWAAGPTLQRALVLEQNGQLHDAQVSAIEATRREPANWRNWYVLARLDFHLGNSAGWAQAAETVRRLNPRSPLVAQAPISTAPPPQ